MTEGGGLCQDSVDLPLQAREVQLSEFVGVSGQPGNVCASKERAAVRVCGSCTACQCQDSG